MLAMTSTTSSGPPTPSITMLTPAPSEAVSTVPCAICRRQFSRYTCPRCNIPYCSLTCFRSESHAGCSESFYRKEIEADVRSAPSRTAEERLKMMALLKQFEEGAADDSVFETDSDDEDLAHRLGDVDLDSASYEELWAKLTPVERDKFILALGDPSSELAQQLLASEELEKARIEPWWEAPARLDAHEEASPASKAHPLAKRHGALPAMMDVPPAMVHAASASVGSAPILLYNMCALCMAYAYATRSLAASPLCALPPDAPEHAEARRAITHLAPFIADRRSKTIHPTLASVVTDFWSRFEPGKMTAPFLAVLLRDTAMLLRPAPVTLVRRASHGALGTSPPCVSPPNGDGASFDLAGHPSATAILALSDLFALFQAAPCAPPTFPAKVPQSPSGATPQPPHPPSLPLPKLIAAPSSSNTSPSSISPGLPTARPEPQRGAKHITAKLTFYAAHVLGAPTAMLRVLADEVAMRARAVALEGAGVEGANGVNGAREARGAGGCAQMERPAIEELA